MIESGKNGVLRFFPDFCVYFSDGLFKSILAGKGNQSCVFASILTFLLLCVTVKERILGTFLEKWMDVGYEFILFGNRSGYNRYHGDFI